VLVELLDQLRVSVGVRRHQDDPPSRVRSVVEPSAIRSYPRGAADNLWTGPDRGIY
jgi:hypothetical protein